MITIVTYDLVFGLNYYINHEGLMPDEVGLSYPLNQSEHFHYKVMINHSFGVFLHG